MGTGLREKIDKVWSFLKTDSGILLSLLLFFPLGIFLIWKYGNQHKWVKVVATVATVLIFLNGAFWFYGANMFFEEKQALEQEYKELLADRNENFDNYTETHHEFSEYKTRMEPYEKLELADAKKKSSDLEKSDSVMDKIEGLPETTSLSIDHKGQVEEARKLFNTLTKDQKGYADEQALVEKENKIKELEETAKKEAEAKAEQERKEAEAKAEQERKKAEEEQRKKEEEARGYDTGITYDQLARTPDDFSFKKVKFYGKVIQVMEDDETTQIRLAVNDNYDTVMLCEYSSSIVSQRVLEDDHITVSGTSMGLISYKSTMGGTITIPSVLVKKIDQ